MSLVRRSFAISNVMTLGLLCAVPLACGTPEDASLCTAYAELLNANTAVQAIDPTDQSAANAIDVVENYLAGVRRLEQAADGRYGQQLDTLETAVNDVLLTLQSIPDDADYATWGPLIEDDLEAAYNATVPVQQAIDPSCTVATSDS
jgi:hypothetical protein